MSVEKRMMLELPEVKRLVDRIPIARLRIKANPIQLRYFQHAGEAKIPLNAQCEVLGIPWHARKVHADAVCKEALKAAKLLSPAAFNSEMPDDPEKQRQWFKDVSEIVWERLDEKSIIWLARNKKELGAEFRAVAGWLSVHPISHLSVRPKTVLKKRRENSVQGVTITVNRSDVWREASRHFTEMIRDNTLLYGRGVGRPLAIMERSGTHGYAISAGGSGGHTGVDLRSHQDMDANGGLPIPPRLANELAHRGWFAPPEMHLSDSDEPDTTPIDYPQRMKSAYSPGGVHSIRLLTTPEEFTEEGSRMNHCAGSYFRHAKQGRCHVATVELVESGAKVATVEYSPDWEVVQVKSHSNRPVRDSAVLDLIESFRHHARALEQALEETIIPRPVEAGAPEEEIPSSGTWLDRQIARISPPTTRNKRSWQIFDLFAAHKAGA